MSDLDRAIAAVPAGDPGALLDRLEDRSELHYVGMQAVREMPSDWYCPRSEPGRARRDCPECVGEVALDAALAYIYGDDTGAALPDLIRLARHGLALRAEHGPGKCVPVADANRVLGEERARLEGAFSRAAGQLEALRAGVLALHRPEPGVDVGPGGAYPRDVCSCGESFYDNCEEGARLRAVVADTSGEA